MPPSSATATGASADTLAGLIGETAAFACGAHETHRQASGAGTPRQGAGTVVDVVEGRVQVACSDRLRECRVAFGCLVQPIAFDRVAWLDDEEGAGWVIAVLERASDAPATLRLPRECTVTAGARLTLESGGTLGMRAPDLEVAAGRVRLFAKAADLCSEAMSVVGQVMHATFDRMFSRTRLAQRTVTELDGVQAQSIDYRAELIASVSAQNVSVHGQRLTKLRGGQIHMD